MADWNWTVGQVGTVWTFVLEEEDGTDIDLTGKTVTLKYKTYPGGTSTTSRTCTVTGASTGTVTYTLVSGDTTTAGEYAYVFEITSSGYVDHVPDESELHTFQVVAI